MLTLLISISSLLLSASVTSSLDSLARRVAPGHHVAFVIDSLGAQSAGEYYRISLSESDTICANSLSAAAVGLRNLAEGRRGSANTTLPMRYAYNYCTHSYTTPFWDAARWNEEIDRLALRGINMPLVTAGSEAVWLATLRRLGYTDEEALKFIAGPAFRAWWLMNNLEGWGGPVTVSHIERQADLARHILGRMRRLGMQPVLPGYSGMLPHDAPSRLGVAASDQGKWLSFTRPVFMLPSDSAFARIADIYYEEQRRFLGPAKYFSADPFHEGGDLSGIDLQAAAREIHAAMRRVNPEAVWVIQGWQENPRTSILESLPFPDIALLDLQAENVPQYSARPRDYQLHPWVFCMLHNFGGNVGLYGKFDALIARWREARHSSPSLQGVGLTMEGIASVPIMDDFMTDLAWADTIPDRQTWIDDYISRRYGAQTPVSARQAWQLLGATILNSPADSVQQGTTESVFCAQPSLSVKDVSTWANSKRYYSPDSVVKAAFLLLDAAPALIDNPDFRFDLIDVCRQAIAERGRVTLSHMQCADASADVEAYRCLSSRFLSLLLTQDLLLALHPDFCLSSWLAMARAAGETSDQKALNEWNARTLITVWGTREASQSGGLHDYAHREWHGLLSQFYYPRWKLWIDTRLAASLSPEDPQIDWFAHDYPWTLLQSPDDIVAPAPASASSTAFLKRVTELMASIR